MPPKSIGCLEMDVNTNLHAIYPSPIGCLCSVTALKGHERVFNLSWVAFTAQSPCVPRTSRVREWVKDDGIRRFCNKTCRHPSKSWRTAVWDQASWFDLIHAGGQRGISTLCELVSYTTVRCGLLPSHCGLLIIAGWNIVWLNTTAAPLQRMMDMFLIRFSAQFPESPDGRQSETKEMRLSFLKDLTWKHLTWTEEQVSSIWVQRSHGLH